MMHTIPQKEAVRDLVASKLLRYFNTKFEEATPQQLYTAMSSVLRDSMMQRRAGYRKEVYQRDARQVYYISMEFLLGRMLKNTLYNLGLTDVFAEVAELCGQKLEDIYELERDPGLGNGGLGRLAACYLDALSSLSLPAMGFSLRYEYGIFRQRIVDGWQTELPDTWLDSGEPWMVPRFDETIEVCFGGNVSEDWSHGVLKTRHENYYSVLAIPYEMPIAGFGGDGVNVLRLFSAKSPVSIDMQLFSSGRYLQAMEQNAMAEVLCKVLYPDDNHFEGKSLRLKQQYFLVSASVQMIVRSHLKHYGTLDNLHKFKAIQLNDTHPALVIPELMRILMDEHGFSWDAAWHIVSNTVSYTNHTVLPEALEQWPEALFQMHLPRLMPIIREINERACRELFDATEGDLDAVSRMAVLAYGQVRMANLSVIGASHVNGVSALHTQILKDTVFQDFHRVTPGKFLNVTNGIAHRRWLCQANPELSGLLTELIGPAFQSDASALEDLRRFENDAGVLERLARIKRDNKARLAKYVHDTMQVTIDPDSIFDVQAKRLHEYKRQLLNVLHIITLYREILENPNADFLPRTFLFSAKASPGYQAAKRIIHLICKLADTINADKRVNGRIKVVFLEDYRVTVAEVLIPAADLSEQISLAGKEASGTGNMKFMINGALTIGTLDGANVEIRQQVGDENMFLFGLKAGEADGLVNSGYMPSAWYQNNPRLKAAIDSIGSGLLGEKFTDLTLSLLTYDTYLLLADYESYRLAQARANDAYNDQTHWSRMALRNIAGAGIFAADRAVREYADHIWHLKAIR